MAEKFQACLDWFLQAYSPKGIYSPRPDVDCETWEITTYYILCTSGTLPWAAQPFSVLLDRIIEVFDEILLWDTPVVGILPYHRLRLMCQTHVPLYNEPSRMQLLEDRIYEPETDV